MQIVRDELYRDAVRVTGDGHARPRLTAAVIRDEEEQAGYVRELLDIYDEEGADAAFVDTFARRDLPTSSEPERDFDTAGFGIVKILERGRTGTAYPGLPWEPKAAFHALAEYGRASGACDRREDDDVTLPTAKLGRTGLQTSRLGYGAMEMRGPQAWGKPISDDQARTVLNTVLDSGMNLIDTSPDYGDAEEHIGRWISHRRDEFVLVSKCGCPLAADGDPRTFPLHAYTRANVRACVEQSLRRMRTDHLDVLMVHMSPSVAVMQAEDTIAEMQALQDEGAIRFTGMSGNLPNLPEHIAIGVFDVFLLPYSALDRSHEELISAAAAAGAGTIARGSVARPLAAPPEAMPEPLRRPLADHHARLAAAGLDDLADGASTMELLLRFILSHQDLHSVIVGSAQVAHVQANVAAVRKGPLPAEVYGALRERLGAG